MPKLFNCCCWCFVFSLSNAPRACRITRTHQDTRTKEQLQQRYLKRYPFIFMPLIVSSITNSKQQQITE